MNKKNKIIMFPNRRYLTGLFCTIMGIGEDELSSKWDCFYLDTAQSASLVLW